MAERVRQLAAVVPDGKRVQDGINRDDPAGPARWQKHLAEALPGPQHPVSEKEAISQARESPVASDQLNRASKAIRQGPVNVRNMPGERATKNRPIIALLPAQYKRVPCRIETLPVHDHEVNG